MTLSACHMTKEPVSDAAPIWTPSEVAPEVMTKAVYEHYPRYGLHPSFSPIQGSASDGDRRGPLRPAVLSPARSRLSEAMLARVLNFFDDGLFAIIAVLVLSDGATHHTLGLGFRNVCPIIFGVLIGGRSLRAFGAYNFGRREHLGIHLGTVLMGLSLICGLSLALAQIFGDNAFQLSMSWCQWSALAILSSHATAWFRVRHWRAKGRLTPNVIIVGATQNAVRLIETALNTREIAVLGIFDDRLDRAPVSIHGVPVLGDTTRLLEHKILPYVDRIVITVTAASQPRVRQLIERLRFLPNAVTLFVDIEGRDGGQDTLARMARLPLHQVSGAEFDDRRIILKRTQDIVLASLAVIIAAPVMAAVALAVRLDSPGPILFRQKRHGFNNEPITVLKFRSMHHATADLTASHQVLDGDARVTRIGHFLRLTSLDELPQLLNVLRGEMSLVGPRPHAIGMKTGSEESARLVAEYAWRHRIKPGITGWAQINGSRGPVHTPEAVRERIALDIAYIERQSFWLDIYILLMTLPVLIGDRCVQR